jgi:hypothetical protein
MSSFLPYTALASRAATTLQLFDLATGASLPNGDFPQNAEDACDYEETFFHPGPIL